jgi:hypothetical protein
MHSFSFSVTYDGSLISSANTIRIIVTHMLLFPDVYIMTFYTDGVIAWHIEKHRVLASIVYLACR